MKSRFQALLGLMLLAALSAADPARAEDARQPCDVPAYLLNSESALPKVAEAVKTGIGLNILVVGSRSSTIASSEGSAYPAQFQAALKQKLPQTAINYP